MYFQREVIVMPYKDSNKQKTYLREYQRKQRALFKQLKEEKQNEAN